jgi:aryl-alcohol dehydrogenase-like predicted oxidoreductase
MKIAIGTAQFGLDYGISNNDGRTVPSETRRILEYAGEVGIDLLDTAREYGDCEKIIGNIISEEKRDFKIVTKVGKEANIDEDVLESMSMLSLQNVYGILIHNTGVLFGDNGKEIYRKLESKKDSGLAEKIGVSVYTPEETMKILDNFNIDVIQFPTSILDQRFLNSGVMNVLKEKNIEIHVRSIFLQGLYFMSLIPSYLGSLEDEVTQISNTARDLGISKLKLMIDYAKSLNVDKIVIGVNCLEQFKEIVSEYNKEDTVIDFKQFSSDSKLVDPRFWGK